VEVEIEDQADLDSLLKRTHAAGLIPLSRPNILVKKFQNLGQSSVYYLRTTERLENLENWQRKENQILETEVAECFVKQAPPDFGKLVIRDDLRKVNVTEHRQDDSEESLVQEWDGVIANTRQVFLLEVKHSVREKHIRESLKKKKELDAALAENKISGWEQFCKTVLVIGGSDFPQHLRSQCKDHGIMIVRPSGGRFCLEM
jgi:hypothetical protein